MAVLVLQALAVKRGAASGGAEHEAATARVAERPDLVADALESEHRVVDVERDHGWPWVAYAVPAAVKQAIDPASVMPSSRIWPSLASRY